MQAPRVLTVPQPWAWAVTVGIQQTIVCSWKDGTSFTGPVLIHAPLKQFDLEGADQLVMHGHEIPPSLPRRAIVGRAHLACCVSAEVAKRVLSNPEQYDQGPWHLVLTHPEVASYPMRANNTSPSNRGLGVAPRGWKAAFTPSSTAS